MFKDRLREELAKAGMTPQVLAEKAGVAQSNVYFWLRGSEPRLSTYQRLLEILPGLRETSDEAAAS